MHVGIFKTLAFPVRFGLLSTYKQICRALKPELLENSFRGENSALLCLCVYRKRVFFG